MSDYLWTQAYVTAFNIDLNILFEIWPIVFPANELFCFVDSKMSC